MPREDLFSQLGEPRLRAVVDDFYTRVLADHMIGFMFEDVVRRMGRQHLIDREFELIANLLGAEGIPYTGRPMRQAHARHAIFVGFFDRRLQILRETLRDNAVPEDIQKVWLDHTESLREQIIRSKPDPFAPAPAPAGLTKLGRRTR